MQREVSDAIAAFTVHSTESLVLKNEIAHLKAQKEAKLKILADIEANEVQYGKAEGLDNFDEQLKTLDERSHVLKEYLQYFPSDDFEFNQVFRTNEQYVKSFWDELKKIHANSKIIQDDLENLRKLISTRDEVREKARALMNYSQ